MVKANKILPAGLVVLVSFFLFSSKLSSSHVFADDFTRDLYDILNITRGKLTLLGPALSFGGLRSGPYYYYLFAPIIFLTRTSINSVLYFNAALFSLALGFFFYKFQGRVGVGRGLLASAVISLVPVYIYASRNPSNAFTYLPLLLLLLTLISFGKVWSKKRLFLLGILGGIIANFHFATIPLAIFLFAVIFLRLEKKVGVIFLGLGFVMTFLPLIFFEARHNFVMIRTTFTTSAAFLENRNLGSLPDSVLPDKYIPNNFFILLSQVGKWLTLEPIFLVILGSSLVFVGRKRNVVTFLFAASLISLFLMAVIMKGQFSPHYLVSYSFLLFFSVAVLLAESRWIFLLPVVIGIEVFTFPSQYYFPSGSMPERFERVADFAISRSLVSRTTPFNVLRIVERTNPVTLGYEYRYFFRLRGYEVNQISEFASAKTLLIFSDRPDSDLLHIGSWEIDQFGRDRVEGVQKFELGSLTIYQLQK